MLFVCLILVLFTDLYAVEQRSISINRLNNPYINGLEENLSYRVITHLQDFYRSNRVPPMPEGALTPQLFIQNETERRKKIESKQKEKLNIINHFIKFIKSEQTMLELRKIGEIFESFNMLMPPQKRLLHERFNDYQRKDYIKFLLKLLDDIIKSE